MSGAFAVARRDLGEGIGLVEVAGEVDLYTAPELKQALRRVSSDARQDVIVDLSATTFIDSTALGVLIGARKRMRESGGTLVVVCPEPSLWNVFELTHLDRVFDLFVSAETAFAHLTRARTRSDGL